jgi:hypothetical protein
VWHNSKKGHKESRSKEREEDEEISLGGEATLPFLL